MVTILVDKHDVKKIEETCKRLGLSSKVMDPAYVDSSDSLYIVDYTHGYGVGLAKKVRAENPKAKILMFYPRVRDYVRSEIEKMGFIAYESSDFFSKLKDIIKEAAKGYDETAVGGQIPNQTRPNVSALVLENQQMHSLCYYFCVPITTIVSLAMLNKRCFLPGLARTPIIISSGNKNALPNALAAAAPRVAFLPLVLISLRLRALFPMLCLPSLSRTVQ